MPGGVFAIALGTPWLVLLGLLLALERVIPARRQRGDWLNNGWAWLLAFGAGVVVTPAAGGAATLIVNRLGGGWIRLPDSGVGLALGVLAYLVAMDFGEYLFHRAQHLIPAMWAMHSLHHSDPGVNVTTTSRHFWLEAAIKSVTIWLAVGLLFKASPKIVVLYGLATFYNLVLHANLRVGFGRFSFVLNSPQYHRLHHGSDPKYANCNFAALLSVWDVLFGAYRPPAAGEFPHTGLEDRPPPKGLWQCFAWPLASGRSEAGGQPAPAALGSVS
ncbi:MAG TPA: sterol desaturase family protein [Caulobacteraceae bacterium]|nr:sterol desaturase family protein [Caulobacteraceae bacterium]